MKQVYKLDLITNRYFFIFFLYFYNNDLLRVFCPNQYISLQLATKIYDYYSKKKTKQK